MHLYTHVKIPKNNICEYALKENDPFIIFEAEKNKEDTGEF